MKSEPPRARALRRQLTATFYRKNKATFFVTAGAMLLLGGALLAVAWILQQIIDIASRSFRERGFEGVSLSDLAREAGVTRNLVYHYFPNKGALFEAVLDHRAEHLLERLPEPRGAEADKDLLGIPMRKQFLYAHTAWAKEKIEERLARALGLAPEDPSQKAVSAFTGMLLSFLMDNMSNELFRNRDHESAEYFVRILREMIERLPVTEPKPFQ